MNRPPGSRIVIDPIDERRWRVSIPGKPTRGRLFATLFLLCWLAGWAVEEVFALRALFARQKDPSVDLPLVAWALAWTAGGIAGVWLLRRVLDFSFGIETFLIGPERFRYIRTLWGRSSFSDFDLREVERFETGPRFRVRGKAVRFGGSLPPEEREWLVGELEHILADVKDER